MAEAGGGQDPVHRDLPPEPRLHLMVVTGRVQPSSDLSVSAGVGTSMAVVEPSSGLISGAREGVTGLESDSREGVREDGHSADDGESGSCRDPDIDNVSRGHGDGPSMVFEQDDINRRSSSAPPCTPTSVSTAMASSSLHHVARLPVQHAPAETMQQSERQSVEDRNISPDDLEEGGYLHDDMSPEPYCTSSPGPGGMGRVYKCRFCSFSTTIYTHLQFHMTKHSSHKVMKCSLCDYCTTDKSSFRRHKRLHVRTNPTTVLHCEKCDYSTTLARKMREHYSHAHNEDYGPSLISTSSIGLRSVPYTNGPYNNLARNLCSPPTIRSGLDAAPIGGGASSFHSFLAQPHGTIQFARGNPPHLITGCVNSGFAPAAAGGGSHHYDDGRRLVLREDNRMASDCLRNIVSNIISHPRVPATSTITSSSLFLTGSAAPHQPPCSLSPPSSHQAHQPHLHHHQHHHQQPSHSLSGRRAPVTLHHQGEQVRVKVEPIDCDGVSDVSSSGAPAFYEREREREQMERRPHCVEPQTTSMSRQRLSLDPVLPHSEGFTDQSDEVAPSGEAYRVSQSSEAASSHNDARGVSVGETDHSERIVSLGEGDGLPASLPVKLEVSSVGTQCSFAVKSESSTGVTVAAAEQGSEWRRLRYLVIERGVQCELLSSTSPRRIASRTLSADSEQQSMIGSDTRCAHCGITFDDEVLFSIHIGCHSHTDPFICNVCGKKCYNKYGFYSHIMRGHHF